MTSVIQHPPELLNADGRRRRVGVEIEFGGIEAVDAAAMVQQLYGGRIREESRHRVEVLRTQLGDFSVEIDSHYVHDLHADDSSLGSKIKGGLAEVAGDVVSLWLPSEIVAPPVEIDELAAINRLVPGLRALHAEGTTSSPIYAFGLQLNPEVPSTEPESLTRHLQAYMVLSPWLRASIDVDATRQMLPFVRPFPEEYVREVLAPGYRPDLHRLVADYLAANATRDRELDLLPLFAHLAPDQVAVLDDPLIKPRPTFHYRLPNSRVDDPRWGGVLEEWNRWVVVERLAADRERLDRARRAHLESHPIEDWIDRLRHLLEL